MGHDKKKKALAGFSAGNGAGSAKNAARYLVKTNTSKTTVLNIIDKSVKTAKGKPTSWVRYDGPHKGANYPHININKAVSGVPDPHTPITAGQLAAAGNTGKVLEVMNKVGPAMTVAAVAIDAARVGMSVYDDAKCGTTRNTVETTASIAGGWGGGFGGAWTGSAIGTAICPGIGTLIGAVVGGISGGISGSVASTAITNAIADECEYDVEPRWCKQCGEKFLARLYLSDERYERRCPDCR